MYVNNIPIIYEEPLQYFFSNFKLNNNDSMILEFGVWSGRTINYISSNTNQKVYGFDSFEGLSNDWDRGDETSKMFKKNHFNMMNKLPTVNSNVFLIKGWFDNSLEPFLLNQNKKIKFIHIDCDLYESTSCIFNLCYKYFDDKVFLVFDEIFNYPNWKNGEYKALIELIDLLKKNYKFNWIGRFDNRNQIYKDTLEKAHYGKALGYFEKIK